MATAIAAVVTPGLTRWAGLPLFYVMATTILIVAWMAAVGMGNYLKGILSGLTGDTYGAMNEVTEALVLIAFAFLAKNYAP